MMTRIPPESVVAAADGSAEADEAVRWAAEQAALERRPLVVFTAVRQSPAMIGSWPGPTYTAPAGELTATAQAVAEAATALAMHHRPGLTTHTVSVALDPRTALADLTSQVHLLVLGSRGRGPLVSKLLGSVGASVVRHAACPVIICRPSADHQARAGVLVGADGTVGSHPVIDFAFRQASLRSQPLTVLHSVSDELAAEIAYGRSGPAPDHGATRRSVAEAMAGFGDRYPEVQFSLEAARGYAADTLAIAADSHDLVVIGHHSAETVADRISGATATAVLERSHTHVAVVPEPN